ncbi:MAG: MEMO1 family protein [Candidatus Altiarchaeota archaeon]
MIRSPAVAGQFYYYDSRMLEEQVSSFMVEGAEKEDVLGVVAPHAGFMYSGAAAGEVYSRITPADTYVIVGPNHTGLGAAYSIVTSGVWRMPFGEVEVNRDLAQNIILNSKYLEEDVLAHQHEHSIEVQLPFIHGLGKDFTFVPVCVGHMPLSDYSLEVARDIGSAVAKAANKTNERVVVVASTDLTHYEPQKMAEEKDRAVLDAIVSLDPKRLFEEVGRRKVSMCGYGPTAIMLYACLALGARKAEVVKYMTSGDVTGDFRQVVGYAGVIVK